MPSGGNTKANGNYKRMKKNKNFIKSLKCAVSGVLKPFRTEANLRFHFMIANLIVIFAYAFGITKTEWAILIITIFSVIIAELINTSVENAVDTATEEYKETAKAAKDIAAGAVLLSAVCSLIIGFILFFNPEKIKAALILIFTTPKLFVLSFVLFAVDILFLIFGGEKKKG